MYTTKAVWCLVLLMVNDPSMDSIPTRDLAAAAVARPPCGMQSAIPAQPATGNEFSRVTAEDSVDSTQLTK